MSVLIYDDIKGIVQDVIGGYNPSDLIEGVVYSTEPFQVEVDGNANIYPPSAFIVPEHLTKRSINVSYSGTNSAIPEGLTFEGELTIDNSLKVGDSVLMLKCQQGQKYLVLDRRAQS